MNTYQFEVKHITNAGREELERGYMCARTYGEAVAKLVEFYEEDSIYAFNLQFVNEDGMVFVPNNIKLKSITEHSSF